MGQQGVGGLNARFKNKHKLSRWQTLEMEVIEWLDLVVVWPARRVWIRVATRLRMRKTAGLGKLRQEVRTCEYEDVRVMWELLNKSDAGVGRKKPRQATWTAFDWVSSGAPFNLCRSF